MCSATRRHGRIAAFGGPSDVLLTDHRQFQPLHLGRASYARAHGDQLPDRIAPVRSAGDRAVVEEPAHPLADLLLYVLLPRYPAARTALSHLLRQRAVLDAA